jgi:hypothetical protein
MSWGGNRNFRPERFPLHLDDRLITMLYGFERSPWLNGCRAVEDFMGLGHLQGESYKNLLQSAKPSQIYGSKKPLKLETGTR